MLAGLPAGFHHQTAMHRQSIRHVIEMESQAVIPTQPQKSLLLMARADQYCRDNWQSEIQAVTQTSLVQRLEFYGSTQVTCAVSGMSALWLSRLYFQAVAQTGARIILHMLTMVQC